MYIIKIEYKIILFIYFLNLNKIYAVDFIWQNTQTYAK